MSVGVYACGKFSENLKISYPFEHLFPLSVRQAAETLAVN